MNNYGLNELRQVFFMVASKIITYTDINKAAYVVNAGQRRVLTEAGFVAGIFPSVTVVPLRVLGTNRIIEASYYGSRRAGSGRAPEYRMGRFLAWGDLGDELVFATDGRDVYVCKTDRDTESSPDIRGDYEGTAVGINEALDLDDLVTRATGADPNPGTRTVSTTVYNRDPAIVAFARRRSDYSCEMPGCDYRGFTKDSGEQYIETHHMIPMAEGGEDSVFNVAAVCPNCHKELHYANNRQELADTLRDAVEQANSNAGIQG